MSFYRRKRNKSKKSKVKKLIRISKLRKNSKSESNPNIKSIMIKKKDGLIEKFSIIKLRNSIKKAAGEAKVPPAKINKLAKEITNPLIDSLKKKGFGDSNKIRNLILKQLDKKAKSVSRAWRKFEKKK